MSRIEQAEGVVCAALEDGAVLLDVERGVYHGLDEVGLRIWTLLGEGNDPAAIAERLAGEYDAAPADIRADLGAFLDALRAQGLVREAATARAATGAG